MFYQFAPSELITERLKFVISICSCAGNAGKASAHTAIATTIAGIHLLGFRFDIAVFLLGVFTPQQTQYPIAKWSRETSLADMAGSMPHRGRDSLLPAVPFFQILFQLRRDSHDLYTDGKTWIGQNCNRESPRNIAPLTERVRKTPAGIT